MNSLAVGAVAGTVAVMAAPAAFVLLLAPAASQGACAAAPIVQGRYTQEQIAELWVASGGPADQAETAGAVGMAESGGDPTIVNRIGAGGLMQIHPPEPDYLQPEVNMRIAVRKWGAAGWQPWEAYTGPDGQGDDGPWRQFIGKGAFALTGLPGGGECDSTLPDGATSVTLPDGTPWLAAVPGNPGERCDSRIVPDVVALIRRYRVTVTDCYATSGHAADGEHPLGLGIDLAPGPGGTWDDVDRLARDVGWTRACGASGVRPACPLKPWVRFVGYDGYPNHGRGNHLHISWDHGPGRPASTVTVFSGGTT